ncbi:hypothetical protein Tco_1414869 [Tanacetum coccineum]
MQEDNTHQGKSPKELKDARHKCKYLCYGMEGGNTVGMVREVMYEHCFRNLGPDIKAKLRESRVPLVGFSWEVNYDTSERTMWNLTLDGNEKPRSHSSLHTLYTNYNSTLSIIHSMIKFPTANGIKTMVTKRETLQECQRIEEAHGPTPEKEGTGETRVLEREAIAQIEGRWLWRSMKNGSSPE